jgi:DNA-binding SARP family transcriptional activator/Flp pilus assembly protein TadD
MIAEFRLLGDVEVRIDGRVIDVGHARQRCVLVALLVDANRTVSVDALVERVWADRPPQRARSAVYSYLSRLRQALAAAPEVRIARQHGGYFVTVDAMAVDVHRFHGLVARAHAAADAAAAAALLDEALGLWRGDVFASLDTPWLNTVRLALDRDRMAAELDRNDVRLRLGEHARLLGALSRAAAAHPLDERLAGQLMLALYRCGRPADALRRYEEVRLLLADELGADPGPPLRQLHQQIVTNDVPPTIPAAVCGARSEWLPVPRQLPPPPRCFAGRGEALAQLDAVLAAPTRHPAGVVISAVSGTAGVGKTALAVHWAHRVADQFPDGQLYVNLRGFDPGGIVMAPGEAVRGFLNALAVPPEHLPPDLNAQVSQYRTLLAGRRMLILLDNARDADQVRPLLPGASGCLVVVTSRNQLSGLVAAEGAHPLILDLLDLDESRELLVRHLGASRVASQTRAVEEIIARCSRLPLALTIVAARAATHPGFPLTALAAELGEGGDRLDALTDGDPGQNVRAVFSWSYTALTPPDARLFRLLGLHPGPDISTQAAASVAGLPVPRVRPMLAELARAHLIVERTPGRYAFHNLLRVYAAEQAHGSDSDDERRAAMQRLFDHYAHTAHTAGRLLDPARDEPVAPIPILSGVTPVALTGPNEARAWLSDERSVILAVIAQAAGTGFDCHVCQLAWGVGRFLDRQGYWDDCVHIGHAALVAARRLGDQTRQAIAHRRLGPACANLGQYAQARAHLRHAIDLYGELDDASGQACSLLNLAWILAMVMRDRYEEALQYSQAALHLYQGTGDRCGQAQALNAIGWTHAHLGDYHQAVTCARQALGLFQSLGDHVSQVDAWDTLGFTFRELGNHERAFTCYRYALAMARHIGDPSFVARILTHLGDSHQAAGVPDAARTAWQQALTILDKLGHPGAGQVRAKLHDARAVSPAQ